MLWKCVPIRYTVYLLSALGSTSVGALYSSINFAWVCIVNGTNNIDGIDWDADQQQVIFAAYSVGGLISSIPAGQLLSRLGCRVVYAVAITIASVSTTLIPLGVKHKNVWAVATFRVVTGLGAILFFPVAFSVSSTWAPSSESGIVLALGTSGFQIGQFFAILLAGVECEHLGYEWIFYLDGLLGILFATLWITYYRDDPGSHSFITKKEADLITSSRANKTERKTTKVPWIKFFTNLPIFTCLICRVLAIYVSWSMNQFIPTFLRDILLLDPQTNGFLSSLPILAAAFGRFASGFISDREWRTSDFRVKLNNTICFTGAGLCALIMALMNPGPDKIAGSIFLLLVLLFSTAFFTGGHMKAPLYNAPEYSAAIGSLMSGFGCMSSIAMPFIVATITRDGTIAEWNAMFYTITGVGVVGTVLFLALGNTKHQRLTNDVNATDNDTAGK